MSLETGSDSSVSEIETPVSIGTVAPELTHEEVAGPTINEPNRNEIETSSSSAPALESPQIPVSEQAPNNLLLVESSETEVQQKTKTKTVQKKRRRKGQKQQFQEDNNIDVDFARHLDMSCMDAGVSAPSISDGFVHEYIQY